MSSNKDPQEYQLPEPAYTSYQTDSTMRRTELRSFSGDQVRAAYAAGLAAAKPKKAAKPKAGEPPKPADVADQTWADFLAVRKIRKAPLTPTALALIVAAAAKAGYTLEAALQVCCERGWQSFRADWVAPQRSAPGSLGGRNYGTSNGHF